MDDDVFDEAMARFHRTGPEFDGWLSNHGPMAAAVAVESDRGNPVALAAADAAATLLA